LSDLGAADNIKGPSRQLMPLRREKYSRVTLCGNRWQGGAVDLLGKQVQLRELRRDGNRMIGPHLTGKLKIRLGNLGAARTDRIVLGIGDDFQGVPSRLF
jgi:hypothetical protein